MADKKVIAESDITAQQMKEFWSQVASGKINRQNLQKFLEQAVEFDPHKFFVTSPGLWVSDGFRDRILSVAKKTAKVSVGGISHFNLPKPMNDTEIQKELGDGHIYEDVSEFCSVLAGMISRQPNGENGDLINNCSANIFYARGKGGDVFAVFVFWYAGDREWGVSASLLGGDRWYAGDRAFSRNSILDKQSL